MGKVWVERDDELESLYLDHADRLWRALRAYAGDPEIASDAVAESFAQYLRGRQSIRSPARWIWRAAFRIAAGELKERSIKGGMASVPDAPADQPTGELLWALGLLPSRQRAVLLLHYYGGYKAREIAGIIGSTAPTVRVHLSRGRKRLRRLLEEDHA